MESEVPEGSDLSADWQRRLNPTARFSDRAEIYHNSRPHYPRGILTVLEEQCGFTAGSLVVDVGAGTGLLAELFLQNGNSVVAVEPNGAMRSALTTLRSSYPRLTPVEGTAEAIPFGDHSANFITAGTAFHWFDIPTVRLEFPRVLKPGGWVVITVNDRRLGPEPFLAEYEQLLARFGRDFAEVTSRSAAGRRVLRARPFSNRDPRKSSADGSPNARRPHPLFLVYALAWGSAIS
jgi:ubiquinone/menaquinone biosynthesis C-methylase UbiE